ncbi:HlyD family efflux transporter periplasmic adaptor subunit [Natranaerobius trueperi]|uniref:Uncharacterized protein n=1 Tax=Natranaerobius trueperi TaxID=759412 RepID=A0A226BZC5_9FIRM|nr:HlyD family efflux transporter periplasmic adaptor subunit [Natranaerobius trueperi]OWZ84142.1 hypothetical protein CDO51_04540 [Natranaerobius trueperi]
MNRNSNTGNVVNFPKNRNKKPRNDSKRQPSLLPLLILFLLILFLVLFLSWARSFIFARFVDIEVLEKDKQEYWLEDLTAVIRRDEEIVYAPVSGKTNRLVQEGKRVQKGQPIISYDQVSITEKDFQTTDDIANEINKTLARFEIELSALRNQDSSGAHISETIEELKELDSNYQELVNPDIELGNTDESTKINAPKPGIISFFIDGLEEKLDKESITPEKINQYKGQYEEYLQDYEVAVARAPLFKMVDNHRWEAMVIVNSSKLSYFDEGKSVPTEFHFNQGDTLTGKVLDVKEHDDYGIVNLEFRREIEDFWETRFTEVNLVKNTRTGFKIPESALTEKDGQTGVYLIKRGIVRFKSIEIIDELKADDYVLADGLDEGSLIVTSTFFVREGDKLR